jgi:V8-like Glu-specific endopeptidase
MIQRSFYLIISSLILFSGTLKADEGLWIPLFLEKYNIEDMQKKGFKLSAEDIYSVNQASMKDAVMRLGGGCTAELISDQGLIITNYHCAVSFIQSHSSLEKDYLTTGFWAMSKKEELINKNLTVTFLVRMEEVTDKVYKGISEGMSFEEKQKIKTENIKVLEAEAAKDKDHQVGIKSFFYGNQYIMFVEKVFKDVRLVGAPPSSIGSFGGDTDNWMWPRHTGDFTLLRIYADENNEPAEYAESNVPYKPAKHFPISLKGYEKGDFTMVFGYPGSTEQYLTSYAVDMIKNKINPHRIEIRQSVIDIMSDYIENDPKTSIQYTSKYNDVYNYWKKWKGENRGLEILNAVEKKKMQESVLTDWIQKDPERQSKYARLLPQFETVYAEYTPFLKANEFFYEAFLRMESVRFSSAMATLLQKGPAMQAKDIENIKKYAKGFFKDYNRDMDKELFKKLLLLYVQNAGSDFQPDLLNFKDQLSHFDISAESAIDHFTDYYFENTFYLDEQKFFEFIEKFTYGSESDEKVKETPGYVFFYDFVVVYYTKIIPFKEKYENIINKMNHDYMNLLMEADSSKIFYPDANSTLRVSYGQVDTYEPKDGVKYKHFTTLEGVMDKDNPDVYDYDVPDKLKELYRAKEYGRYGENGIMPVCFIASNHTSGGNSGSPVINANGELIGINFDRNWEGTMSDIMYNPDQCRNISLDVRYALFIIDKFAGAKHLIEEMTIID